MRTRPAEEWRQSVLLIYKHTPGTVTSCSSWLSSSSQPKGWLEWQKWKWEGIPFTHLLYKNISLGKMYLLKCSGCLLCMRRAWLGQGWLPQLVSPLGSCDEGLLQPHLQQHPGSLCVEWVTNENMKEKTGGGGRRQEPEWPMAEGRRQEKKGGVMV